MLLIAKGIKAHGIKGDIKINCFTDTPATISQLKKVIIKGKTYKVEKVRDIGASFALLKLEGIDTMNQAELFRDAQVYSERAKMPKLQEGSYYIDDLLGAKIMVDGSKLGILTEILQYGSADVYVINTDKGMVMFPFIDGVVDKIDPAERIIYVNKQEFSKVAVYEN